LKLASDIIIAINAYKVNFFKKKILTLLGKRYTI